MADAPDKYPLLARIDSPRYLKRLRVADLPKLAAELREYLIQNVATRGCHFAAGLGTVEEAAFRDQSEKCKAAGKAAINILTYPDIPAGTRLIQNLPTTIYSIAYDSQGRLLFGTENGLFRGVPRGFGYDYTTGGAGILRNQASAINPPAMAPQMLPIPPTTMAEMPLSPSASPMKGWTCR